MPPFYGLGNPYINLKSENSQDYAQKPQRNCMFMNSASVVNTIRLKHRGILYGRYLGRGGNSLRKGGVISSKETKREGQKRELLGM
jgi:hypothetical protein